MEIKAIDVKKLREETNAGMMDCKKALLESDGDFEKAKLLLREKGQSKADKKSGRTTAQGLVRVETNDDHISILEVNCETDFAAKDTLFDDFVSKISKLILSDSIDTIDQLNVQGIDEFGTVEDFRKFVVSKIGENILTKQVEDEGKPAEIVPKIVEGKLNKQLNSITLMGQEFIKDPDLTVAKLLDKNGASVLSFVRYEVGEGVEVEEVNFADEVKAQVDAVN